MNKKTLSILVAVVALFLAVCVAAAILIKPANVSGGGTEPSGTADTTDTAEEPSDPQTGTDDTSVNSTEAGPNVELAVGERGDYDSGDQTESSGKEDQTQTQDKDQTENAGNGEQSTATQPEQTQPSVPADPDPATLTFAQYEALSEDEQEAFVESFESVSAFVDWWKAAKKEQEDRETAEIVDGKIDLGSLVP